LQSLPSHRVAVGGNKDRVKDRTQISNLPNWSKERTAKQAQPDTLQAEWKGKATKTRKELG
jgi:hypothetical protein